MADRAKSDGLTHLIWAFALVDGNSFELQLGDPNESQSVHRFANLKTDTLHTWVGVAGWHITHNDDGTKNIMSDIVSTPENRAKFIKSVQPYLDKYGFQGIDIGG